DHGRIVDVRIEVVLELEGPSAGRELGAPDRPVTLDADLLGEQVLACLDELRVVRREAGGAEGERREARVPDRRLTGFRPQPVAFVDHETVPAVDALAEGLVLAPVAEGGEEEQRPDPRRLDAAPGAVGLLPLADPTLGLTQRAPPDRRQLGDPSRRPRLARPGADLGEVAVRLAGPP